MYLSNALGHLYKYVRVFQKKNSKKINKSYFCLIIQIIFSYLQIEHSHMSQKYNI